MISVAEAAARLDVPSQTVYRMVHAGRLRAYRLPGRARIWLDHEDVEAIRNPVPVVNDGDPEEQCLTPTEVARLLKCSPRHVRRLALDGELEAIRISGGTHGRVRIPAASVRAYLQRKRVGA